MLSLCQGLLTITAGKPKEIQGQAAVSFGAKSSLSLLQGRSSFRTNKLQTEVDVRLGRLCTTAPSLASYTE